MRESQFNFLLSEKLYKSIQQQIQLDSIIVNNLITYNKITKKSLNNPQVVMSSPYSHEQQDQVPILLPLKKKNDLSLISPMSAEKPTHKNNDALNNIIKDSISKSPMSIDQTGQGHGTKKEDKYFGQSKTKGKIPGIGLGASQNLSNANAQTAKQKPEDDKNVKDKKGKKENQYNKLDNEKLRQNQKMKSLIAQMLNSMSVKNLTQQLYPVSNQIIQQLLSKIQDEISQLTMQADRKSANQNNLHVDKQLQVIKRQINHCVLIKQLYYQKMNYRNKIQSLQQQIINLRTENRDLKLKVSRGIQSIQNYKHNLPCDREKQLIQKLSICTQQLTQQREMRQNLQKNIQSIIMNFKKLYDQADAARKIVTQKLQEVVQREKQIKKSIKKNEQNKDLLKQSGTRNRKFNNSIDDFGEQRQQGFHQDRQSNEYYQNINNRNGATSKRYQQDHNYKRGTNLGQSGVGTGGKPIMVLQSVKQDGGNRDRQRDIDKHKQKQQKQREKDQSRKTLNEPSNNGVMSLQQKIKKMRNNQINFKKTLQN